jgi:hypothetical protein
MTTVDKRAASVRFRTEAEVIFGLDRASYEAYRYAEARINGASICRALRVGERVYGGRWKHGYRVN